MKQVQQEIIDVKLNSNCKHTFKKAQDDALKTFFQYELILECIKCGGWELHTRKTQINTPSDHEISCSGHDSW